MTNSFKTNTYNMCADETKTNIKQNKNTMLKNFDVDATLGQCPGSGNPDTSAEMPGEPFCSTGTEPVASKVLRPIEREISLILIYQD
ncbi:MAG: hypothetical protein IPN76_15305 [Saprospiraceae bacterium]|nr:hypothetical protein [Saprospiraceae bacterium]